MFQCFRLNQFDNPLLSKPIHTSLPNPLVLRIYCRKLCGFHHPIVGPPHTISSVDSTTSNIYTFSKISCVQQSKQKLIRQYRSRQHLFILHHASYEIFSSGTRFRLFLDTRNSPRILRSSVDPPLSLQIPIVT